MTDLDDFVNHVKDCIGAEAAIVAQSGQIEGNPLGDDYELVETQYLMGKRIRIYERKSDEQGVHIGDRPSADEGAP